jgi:hypothetical protein
MKECNKCNKIKDYSEFSVHHTNLDGHSGKCKECARDYWKQYYARVSQDRTWRAKQSQRQKTYGGNK